MLFFGFVLAVSLNSLVFYYWSRIAAFLYYSIFVLGIGIFAGLMGGITEYFPFSLSERHFYWSSEIISSAFSIAYLQFARLFLNTPKNYQASDHFVVFAIFAIVILPNYYSGDWVLISVLVNILYSSVCITLGYLAWLEYGKGKNYALYMMLSTVLMSITFFGDAISYSLNLNDSEVAVDDYISGNRLLILCAISALEMLLFSTALAGLFKQAQQQKEEVEQSSQIRSRFFSAASHDIKQPLYALRSFNTALSQTDDPELIQTLTQKIDYSVATMNQLFDSLLVSTRLEAGVEEVFPRAFLVPEMLQRLKAEFSIQAKQKNIELRIQGIEVTLESDQLLLERILRNLLSNAFNYMDKDSGGIVDLIVEIRQSELLFSVKDNGLGLNGEQSEHVFDEFSRFGGSHQFSTPGSGLGLFIVKQTGSLLGCEIVIDSILGEGSTFTALFRDSFYVTGEQKAQEVGGAL